MRKVSAGLFISLDGVIESPEKWQFDRFDEGMRSEDEPFASDINSVAKYVVSRTLKGVSWANASLIGSDLSGEIADLKQQPGKNIGVAGSPTLVRSMVEDDLLDELILMVHPVIAGSGERLFDTDMPTKRLELADLTRTPSGVAIQTYQRRVG